MTSPTPQQDGWRARFAEYEPRHWYCFIGIGFVLMSPFFALAQLAAGFLAFGVGGLAIFCAVANVPDDDDGEERQ